LDEVAEIRFAFAGNQKVAKMRACLRCYLEVLGKEEAPVKKEEAASYSD
jgi:hypothetical protein